MPGPQSTGEVRDDLDRDARSFARDGVVLCKGVLGTHAMALIERAFEYLLTSPSTTVFKLNTDDDGTTVEAPGYSIDDAPVREVIENTPLADLASRLFGGGPVWYIGEQLWMKRGGNAGRTIWHQDSAFEPYSGAKNAVLWIPLESLPAENVLEVVRGSHQGVTYNPTYSTSKADEHVGIYREPASRMPLVPDIEAQRDKWDIFSAPMNRGDVLVFHENALHGGAPVSPGQIRRTLSFRLVGDDVVYVERPQTRTADLSQYIKKQQGERFHHALEGLRPGQPLSEGPNVRQVHG